MFKGNHLLTASCHSGHGEHMSEALLKINVADNLISANLCVVLVVVNLFILLHCFVMRHINLSYFELWY